MPYRRLVGRALLASKECTCLGTSYAWLVGEDVAGEELRVAEGDAEEEEGKSVEEDSLVCVSISLIPFVWVLNKEDWRWD